MLTLPSPRLFPYQSKTVNQVYDHIRTGKRRVLLVAPTGSGKTNMGACMARDAISRGRQVSVVVHRDFLVDQCLETFEKWGLSCGIVAGGRKENRAADVQICSFQTLSGSRNISWLKSGLVIADESHYTSYTNVMLDWFPKNHYDPNETLYVGLTATPFRLNRRESLGDIFHAVALAPSYKELIAMGNLVKPIYYEVPNSCAGDMLADANYIIESWRAIAQNSPTIVFTQSVSFAEVLSEAFNNAGIGAAPITEKVSRNKRQESYKAFDQDKIKVLCSVSALTEGFDRPKARVAILARNIFSRSSYFQAAGRVMRAFTYPDGTPKTDCIIMDQMGVVRRFGFIEDLEIDESVLQVTHEEPGIMPTKYCPRCKRILYISTKACDKCGYSFDFIGKERFLPKGQMRRVFRNDVERSQYAVYVRMLQKAFSDNLPLSWADKSFLEKFNYFPPSDWRRNAILKNADDATKAEFKAYLLAIASEENRDPYWIMRQLSLELGL